MGTRDSMMPLLSTLAALVIIVHSLDEGMDRDPFAREISPRLSEPGTPDYDQSWRALEVKPRMDEWDETSLGPPKRRRLGRKRKRWPISLSEGDMVNDGQKVFIEDNPSPYHDIEAMPTYETTEQPRRRRKRPEMRNTPWTDEIPDSQRPLRRRGHRRRRPTNPTVHAENHELPIYNAQEFHRPLKYEEHSIDENLWINNNEEIRAERIRPTDPRDTPVLNEEAKEDNKEQRSMEEETVRDIQDEVSSSVFSDEDHVDTRYFRDTTTATVRPKQDGAPIDAASLKALLKRSDGTSLSEILQQRNLSLADLLNGSENAISALQADAVEANLKNDANRSTHEIFASHYENIEDEKVTHEGKRDEKISIPWSQGPLTETMINKTIVSSIVNEPFVVLNSNKSENKVQIKEIGEEKNNFEDTVQEYRPKQASRRRVPPSTRRRQRIKTPANNINSENRTFISAHPNRKLFKVPRNETNMPKKIKIEILTDSNGNKSTNSEIEINITTSNTETEEFSTPVTTIHNNSNINELKVTTNNSYEEKFEPEVKQNIKTTTIPMTLKNIFTTEPLEVLIPDKSESILSKRHNLTSMSELRRQALANRLKRKRNKQKNSTIDADLIEVKDLLGMANIASASEFIAKIQTPMTTLPTTTEEDAEMITTTLDDVTMTEFTTTNITKATKTPSSTPKSTRHSKIPLVTATEDGGKIEIDEILNDSHTSERLSKILSERNMTINELLEHRERGSSQVHLADIFHNTSREPNPPEPFLSKSSIEPISKEIYPLRALLEANHHEQQPVKLQTPEPNNIHYTNIPIVLDFGNNVNENNDNLGIVSLFNRFNSKLERDDSKIKTDSEGVPYFTSVTAVNTANETKQEGRNLEGNDYSKDDYLRAMFIGLQKTFGNETQPLLSDTDNAAPENNKSSTGEEDFDGDGLIVLEDLQHLNDFDSNIAQISNERLEVKMDDDTEPTSDKPDNIFEKIPTNTKSVTAATAAIVGLTMVLFLLTYIGCKWKNQRNAMCKKDSLNDERIPSPVFENRKLSKINSSNRSISPMLSSSNIYTMSTIDSRNGKESPDYAWDSLRKPFQ